MMKHIVKFVQWNLELETVYDMNILGNFFNLIYEHNYHTKPNKNMCVNHIQRQSCWAIIFSYVNKLLSFELLLKYV